MQNTIKNRQSLIDFAIQECGTFESTFTLAEHNDLSVTSDIPAGTEIEFLPEWIDRKNTLRRIEPATALSSQDRELPWGGIGYMAIEFDFIVS
ncbi:MAG: hypothetical protein LUG98_03875 [Tannerellaceae bacterium]|nr:hypothetical protein [Tannerellaceae bacterium]